MLRAREAEPHGRRVCGRASGPGAVAEPSAALRGWAEGDFLRRCDATYCALTPPPRSTIAIAFSPDGALLASTQCAPPPLRSHPTLWVRVADCRAASNGLTGCLPYHVIPFPCNVSTPMQFKRLACAAVPAFKLRALLPLS